VSQLAQLIEHLSENEKAFLSGVLEAVTKRNSTEELRKEVDNLKARLNVLEGIVARMRAA
jgi:ubiquinone biosynthesis protein UbiJ